MTDSEQSPSKPERKAKTKRLLLILLALILIPLIAIQFMPVARANPPVTVEIDAPAEVMTVLRESCYDCHSNQTRWPWYSYVAPVSWFVADHVRVGRANLNFTEWDQYDADTRRFLIDATWHEVNQGEMPLESYLKMHADARLTPEDKAILQAWTSLPALPAGDSGEAGDR